MRENEPDSVLVQRTLAGDLASFDALAARRRPELLRFLQAAIGDGDEAESLTQEAIVRALDRLDQLRPELPFRGYLFGIARNLVRNHFRALRQHARAVPPEQLAEAPSPRGACRSELSELVRGEIRDRLRSAIESLPLPFRQSFIMHFVEGLDYAEISRRTGVSAGALRVRAHRARALLKADLGPVVDSWLTETPRGGNTE